MFVAYPMGSLHKYKVKRTVYGPKAPKPKVSGRRYTFNPYKVGIDCRIVKR